MSFSDRYPQRSARGKRRMSHASPPPSAPTTEIGADPAALSTQQQPNKHQRVDKSPLVFDSSAEQPPMTPVAPSALSSPETEAPELADIEDSVPVTQSAYAFPDIKSKDERIYYIRSLLLRWRWSFPQLAAEWMRAGDGVRKRRSKRQAALLAAALLTDELFLEAIEISQDHMSTVTGLIVRSVRQELQRLQQAVPAFGQFDPDVKFEDIRLETVGEDIRTNAPLLYQLVDDVSQPQWTTSGRRNPHHGRITMMAAMLQLGRARNSANCFLRLLSVALQSQGVKRRTLSLLHGLGVTDGYRAVLEQRASIARRSKARDMSAVNSHPADIPQGGYPSDDSSQ